MLKKLFLHINEETLALSHLSWLFNVRQKILKMTPPSVQKFDLEDSGKLVAIVAASEMTREYLIKQKILPDHINV